MYESEFNLEDEDIRDMIENNHIPQDLWATDSKFIGVFCNRCHYNWPCPTITSLRAWKERL